MTPTELSRYERQAREDEMRSMALFGFVFAALSGLVVGILIGVWA